MSKPYLSRWILIGGAYGCWVANQAGGSIRFNAAQSLELSEISPDGRAAAQAFMANRASSRETVAVDGASHLVMVSHPDAVAEVIEHAAIAQ